MYDTLDQYNQVLGYIQQGRKEFQSDQNLLLGQLSNFDKWRDSGVIFHPWMVSSFGFPTGHLLVTLGNEEVTGAAAEKLMWQIVRNPDAIVAFQTGSQGPLPVPAH